MMSIEPGLSSTGRRSFSIGYRLEFLRAWDGCLERGAKNRLLRENDLTRATVQRWIRSRDRGELEAAMAESANREPGKRRSPGATSASADRAELARLRTENEALRRKVAQSEAAQEVLGKAFELLEGINQSSELDPQIPPALMSADEYAAWLKRQKLT